MTHVSAATLHDLGARGARWSDAASTATAAGSLRRGSPARPRRCGSDAQSPCHGAAWRTTRSAAFWSWRLSRSTRTAAPRSPLRQVLQALGELGRPVDLLTYPVGADVDAFPGLRIFRSANPFGFEQRARSGSPSASHPRPAADAARCGAGWRRERYACIHAVEEAAFPAALLARRSRHPAPLRHAVEPRRAAGPARAAGPLAPARAGAGRDGALAAAPLRAWWSTSAGLAERVRAMAPGLPVREWHFPSAPADADPGGRAGVCASAWAFRRRARSCSTAAPSRPTRGCPT